MRNGQMGTEEIKIIEKAMAGENDAFEKLCRLKNKSILHLTVSIMKNYHDGEDVAQEVLLRVEEGITKLKSSEAFQGWLYRIIVRSCSHELKKRVKEKNTINEDFMKNIREDRIDFLPDESLAMGEMNETVRKIVEALPDNQRVCAVLYYFEGLTYKEIASAMRITESNVGAILTRARKRIEKKLNNNKSLKLYLQGMYGAAVLPAFARSYKLGVNTMVNDEMVHSFTQKALTKCSAQSVGVVKTGGLSMGMKALIGISVSGMLALGGVVGTVVAKDHVDSRQQDQAPSSAIVENKAPQNDILPDDAEGGFDIQKKIRTLEDMIGIENADTLRSYVAVAVNGDAVTAFLEEIEMTAVRKGVNPVTEVIYVLHTRVEQDKLLMVIMRDGGDGRQGAAFRFTDAGEPLPRNLEVIQSYEDWQSH